MGGRGVYSLSNSSSNIKVELHSPRTVKEADAVVEKAKLDYLLSKREKDDKSGYFINVLGYSKDDPDKLAADLITGLKDKEPIKSEKGYRGRLKETYIMELGVSKKKKTKTIWENDGSRLRLITAMPYKEGK